MSSTFNGVPLSSLLSLPEVAAVAEEGETVMWGSYVCPNDHVMVQYWPLLANGSYDAVHSKRGWALSGAITMKIDLNGPQPDKAHFSEVVIPFQHNDVHPHEGHGYIHSALCSGTYEGKWSTDPIISGTMLRTWLVQTLSHGAGIDPVSRGWWMKLKEEFWRAYPLAYLTVVPTKEGGEEVSTVERLTPDMVERYLAGRTVDEVWRPTTSTQGGRR